MSAKTDIMAKKSRPSRVLLSMPCSTVWSRMPRSRRSVPTMMWFWTEWKSWSSWWP
nr:hypothetical protein [Streptomyces inhibens]